MSRIYISPEMIAAGHKASGLNADDLCRIYAAMADARTIPTPAKLNVATLLAGEHWRHFSGWKVQPAQTVGQQRADGRRWVYDIMPDMWRPVAEGEMELAPPEGGRTWGSV